MPPHNDQAVTSEKNSATQAATAPASDTRTASDTSTQPSQNTASAASAPDTQGKKRMGFMGGKGTAPIKTATTHGEQHTTTGAGAGASAKGAAPKTANAGIKPSASTQSFKGMAYMAPLFLLVLLAMQTATGLLFPSVYTPQELKVVEQYQTFLASSQALISGTVLPGYFWFFSFVDAIPYLPDSMLLPVATTVAAAVAVLGTYALALCAGLGNGVAFASGLVLLSCAGFLPLSHFIDVELFFAGVLSFALACIIKGLRSDSAALWLILGGMLTTLAFLVGGMLALWLVTVTNIVFILWSGRLGRAHRLDAVAGFGALLLSLAGWLGAVILLSGESANDLAVLLQKLVDSVRIPPWPVLLLWWQDGVFLLCILLPWTLVPLCVSWGRVLVESAQSIKASRKENAGTSYLWIALALGLVYFLLTKQQGLLAVVALVPCLAILCAKAVLGLSVRGSQIYFMLVALLLIAVGLVLTCAALPYAAPLLATYLPAAVIPVIESVAGLPVLGTVCLLSGVWLFKITDRRQAQGALVVVVLIATMLVQPAVLLLGPSLPKTVAKPHPYGAGIVTFKDSMIPTLDAAKFASGRTAAKAAVAAPSVTPQPPASEGAAPQDATAPSQVPAAEEGAPTPPVAPQPEAPAVPPTAPAPEGGEVPQPATSM